MDEAGQWILHEELWRLILSLGDLANAARWSLVCKSWAAWAAPVLAIPARWKELPLGMTHEWMRAGLHTWPDLIHGNRVAMMAERGTGWANTTFGCYCDARPSYMLSVQWVLFHRYWTNEDMGIYRLSLSDDAGMRMTMEAPLRTILTRAGPDMQRLMAMPSRRVIFPFTTGHSM